MNLTLHPESVLFLTLDSCRFDSFLDAHIPHLKAIAPLHKAQSPSYFTYGSHAAFWMGFTPGISSAVEVPWLNPKYGKLFRMNHSAASSNGKNALNCQVQTSLRDFEASATTQSALELLHGSIKAPHWFGVSSAF